MDANEFIRCGDILALSMHGCLYECCMFGYTDENAHFYVIVYIDREYMCEKHAPKKVLSDEHFAHTHVEDSVDDSTSRVQLFRCVLL